MTLPTRSRLAIAVVLAGVFVSSLDLFIVNIAFPDLERSFHGADVSSLSWVLSAYAIVFAAALVPAGGWADRTGRKRAFLGGLALFTLASAACAVAPSVEALVAARVLQALGGAFMLPTSLGLMLPMFPAARRGAAIGMWAAVGGAAAAAGPPIGGLLVQASWRWVFLVNLPVGLIALLIGARVLTEIRDPARTAPDAIGAAVLAATVGLIVAAIVEGPSWGWGGSRVLGLFVAGIGGIFVTVYRARRHPAPVVEPALLRIRSVSFANLAALFFFTGFGAMVLVSVLFLTGVWHHSIIRAGLEIAPGPMMAATFAIPGGVLGPKLGQRRVGMAGALLFALGGAWWMSRVGVRPDYLGSFLPGMLLGGIGVGLMLPSLSAAATLPLPPERFATGTAMLSMSRQIGLALGVALTVAILGTTPDLGRFTSAWLLQAVCALMAGTTLLAIGARAHLSPVPVPAA